MNLEELFSECINIPYIGVENEGNYAVKKRGDTLYIYLEHSNGKTDWKNNLDFFPVSRRNVWQELCGHICILASSYTMPTKPYKEMGERWFAHRGFLRVWKSIEPYLANDIMDKRYRKIVTVGYSHGAALAVLCHEYVWFHRSDLRKNIEGYGFGCPRVLWGRRTQEMLQRWNRFVVIRNRNDLVTHVPPTWLGFSHVGNMLSIGVRGRYSMIDAHRQENVLTELKALYP